MKSKIKFDLNGQNEAVVSAQIIFDSEDVRDKVARSFHEGLGYKSNLAYVEIHPDTEIHGLLNSSAAATVIGVTMTGRNIQIKTFGGDAESTDKLCYLLCSTQLENLLKAIPKELKRRKALPTVE